jgi:hypothetical protein
VDQVGIARVRLQELLLLGGLLLLLLARGDLGLGLALGNPLQNEVLDLLLLFLLLALLLRLELVQRLLVVVRPGIEFDGDQEGRVLPDPEALGEPVVGLTRGGRFRELAGVLLAETDVEHGQRQDDEDEDGEDQRRHRALADPARPPLPAVSPLVAGPGVERRDLQRVDPVPEEREHRRQERQRRRDGGDHRDRRRVAE